MATKAEKAAALEAADKARKAANANAGDDVAALKARIAALEEELQANEEKATDSENAITDLQQQVEALKKQVEEGKSAVHLNTAKLETLDEDTKAEIYTLLDSIHGLLGPKGNSVVRAGDVEAVRDAVEQVRSKI